MCQKTLHASDRVQGFLFAGCSGWTAFAGTKIAELLNL
jgi:hypothetical protein